MFHRYAELIQDALSPSESAVAILPLAAIETHGPHLPLGTDAIIADGILDEAERIDRQSGTRDAGDVFIRLPTLWLGASAEHADRAGTLSREPEALIATISAVGNGLARAGLRRVLLFNAHGGNVAAAQIAALKLRDTHGFLAASVHWLDFGLPDALTPPASATQDVHGGWIETSVMLHLSPALVAMDQASAQEAAPPAPCLFPNGPVAWGWRASDLASEGHIGRPDLARADLGRMLVDHAAARLCAVLHDLARARWPSAQ